MKRSRESRYNRIDNDLEYDHDYPGTSSQSRRSRDTSRKYTNDDLRILQDIVNLAVQQSEISADVNGTPGRPNTSFHHLHNAYESVLRLNNIEPASDSHFYRFLIKLAAEQGPSWRERFETLVNTMKDSLDYSNADMKIDDFDNTSIKIDDLLDNASTSIHNESEDADGSSSSSDSTMAQLNRQLRLRSPESIARRTKGKDPEDSDASTMSVLNRYLKARNPEDIIPAPKKTVKKNRHKDPFRIKKRRSRPNYFIPVNPSDVESVSTLPSYDEANMLPMTVILRSDSPTATSKATYLRDWNTFILEPKATTMTQNQTNHAERLHATRLVTRALSAWREQLRWFYASQTYVAEARRNFLKERLFHAWKRALKKRRQKSHLILVEQQRLERERQHAEALRRQQQKEEEMRKHEIRLQEYAERQRLHRERKEREQRERVEQEEQERLRRERREREQREHLQQEEEERLYRERLRQEAAHLQALEEQERQRDLARIQDLEREKQQIETQRREALLTEQERQEQRRQQLHITAQIELERQRQDRKEQQREYEAKVEEARLERQQLDRASVAEGFQFWRLKSRENDWTRAQESSLKQSYFRLWYLASWKTRSQVLYETRLSRGAIREWRIRLVETVERNRNHNILLRFRQEQTLLGIFKAWRLRLILNDIEIRNDRRRIDEVWAHWRYTFVESRAINQHAQKQLVRNCLIRWKNHAIDVRARQEEAGIFFEEKSVFHAFALWKLMHRHRIRAQQFHDKRIQKDYLHIWLIYQRCQLLERVHWKRILRNILSAWRQDAQHAMNASLRLEQWEQEHEQTEGLQLVDIFKAWRRKAQVWVNAANYANKTSKSSSLRAALRHWRARLTFVQEADDEVVNARNHFVIVSALNTWRQRAVESRRNKIQRSVEKMQHARNKRALQLNFGTWVVARQRQRSLVELETTMQNLINVRLRGNSMIKWMLAADRHEQSRAIAIEVSNKRIVAVAFRRLVQIIGERKKDHTLQIKVDSIHTLNKLKRHFNHWRTKWQSLQTLVTKADNASKRNLSRTVLAQFAQRAHVIRALHTRMDVFIKHRQIVTKLESFITWHEKASLQSRHILRADRTHGLRTVSNAFDAWKAKYAYAKVRQRLTGRTFLLAWRAIAQRRHALTIALDEASRMRYAFRDAKDEPVVTIYKLKNMRAHFKAWRTRSQKIAHQKTLANAFTKGKQQKSERLLKLRLFSQWQLAAVRKAAKTKEANEKARLATLANASEKVKSRKNSSLLREHWTTWRTRLRATILNKYTSKHRAMILQSWTRIINEEAALKRQVIQRDALRKWIDKTRRELIVRERGREIYEGGVLREALGVWRFHTITRLRERGAKTFDRALRLGKFFGTWRHHANRRVAWRFKKEEQYIKNEDLMRRYQKYRLLRMGLKQWQRHVNARRAERTRRVSASQLAFTFIDNVEHEALCACPYACTNRGLYREKPPTRVCRYCTARATHAIESANG